MATNYSIEILIDTDDQDKRTEIVLRVLQALSQYTRTTTYVATYSTGSSSTNQVTLTVVETGTVNIGIRITWDTAVIGTDETPEVVRKVLQALSSETLTVAHASSYTAGDRAYNVTVALA